MIQRPRQTPLPGVCEDTKEEAKGKRWPRSVARFYDNSLVDTLAYPRTQAFIVGGGERAWYILLSVACVILDQENLRNYTQSCVIENFSLFVGSHFLHVHVRSTFHRKVGLKRAGPRE